MTSFVITQNTRERITKRISRAIDKEFETSDHVEISVGPWEPERSEQQNRALFGLAYGILAEETGHTKEEIHFEMCGGFFGWKDITGLSGDVYRVPARTTTRDEKGKRNVISWRTFSAFYDHVSKVAFDVLGVPLPEPNPQWKEMGEREAA